MLRAAIAALLLYPAGCRGSASPEGASHAMVGTYDVVGTYPIRRRLQGGLAPPSPTDTVNATFAATLVIADSIEGPSDVEGRTFHFPSASISGTFCCNVSGATGAHAWSSTNTILMGDHVVLSLRDAAGYVGVYMDGSFRADTMWGLSYFDPGDQYRYWGSFIARKRR